MALTQKQIESFADVVLKVGLNLQPGDKFTLGVSPETLPFARVISRKAWQMGALDIEYRFTDSEMTLEFFKSAGEEAMNYAPDFKVDYRENLFKAGYHVLGVSDINPSLFKDVDPAVLGKRQMLMASKNKRIMGYTMQNQVKWCVSIIPTQTWADACLPGVEDNLAKLEEAWLKIYRLDQPDPVQAWRDHNETLKRHEAWLNEMNFDHLIYEAPGTELTVGLVKNHRWVGGAGPAANGDIFMANIPTEEIFTMPDKNRVNGKLRSTLPLSLHGHLIEGMEFVFENGKAVSWKAEKGQEVLDQLLKMDENAVYLGEAAIVPVTSPIYQSGLIFKCTLFDENASCHFAFGQAYSENLPGSDKLDDEGKAAAGMNDSVIHVDFMVGSPELRITGVREDGSRVTVLEKGLWAD